LENYEEWDVTVPPLPSRSRLYRLEPIGIETPYVESLTGYIARIAETHCVIPKSLIMGEIVPIRSHTGPILNYYDRLNHLWKDSASTLNGVTPIARQWVEMLQSLTTCDNLRFLTMLTWCEVIGISGLLRRKRAWCSACYEEWRQAHQTVYEPLLWSLASVTICLKHRQLLITVCPRCQKSIPFLTQVTRPGYCSHCGSWLGNSLPPQAVENTSNERAELKYQYWVAEVVGELLAGAPHFSEPPKREQIATMLSQYVEHYAKSNLTALARLVKLNVQVLQRYIWGINAPPFDSLLRICSALSLTPLEFLMAKALPSQEIPKFVADNLPMISRGKGKPVSADDVQRMRQALEAVIAEERDPPPCLREVAESIGYHSNTIRKHCPDLSKRISARYQPRWTEEDCHRMKQELENALKSDERVSLSAIEQKLGVSSTVLRDRFPDLCRAVVTRYHERFAYAQIQRRLQEVLANEEEASSVDELARQMGYNHHILWANFPGLCNQVKERGSAARRKQHNERMATLCNEIRQAVFLLHSQGVYPSARQVFQRLSNIHAIRTKEGHEAWRQALEELGYPTSHLKKYS
jgi:AraC-like DNA-binding protein